MFSNSGATHAANSSFIPFIPLINVILSDLKNWASGNNRKIVFCFWCDQGESNPHGLPHSILSAARLPVPPWSHVGVYIFIKLIFVFQPFL